MLKTDVNDGSDLASPISSGKYWDLITSEYYKYVSEAEPDQTQTKVEGWAERKGSSRGMGETSEAERSTQLPTQPSLPSSECTAGWHIPGTAQKQSGEDGASEERGGGAKVPGMSCHFTVNAYHFQKAADFKRQDIDTVSHIWTSCMDYNRFRSDNLSSILTANTRSFTIQYAVVLGTVHIWTNTGTIPWD